MNLLINDYERHPSHMPSRHYLTLADRDIAAWLEISTEHGAIHDHQSRERLARVGIHAMSCRCLNLLPPHSPWNTALAHRGAIECLGWLTDERYDRVYLVGSRVGHAFGLPSGQYGRWSLGNGGWRHLSRCEEAQVEFVTVPGLDAMIWNLDQKIHDVCKRITTH